MCIRDSYKDEKIATLAEALALCRSMEGCTVSPLAFLGEIFRPRMGALSLIHI